MSDFFSIRVRISNKTYALRAIPILIAQLVAVAAIQSADGFVIFISGTALLFLSIVLFIQTIQRLHDGGDSGFLAVILFMPLLNLILIIYLIVTKGDSYPNIYGPPECWDDNDDY